jgi:3-isopropylmalate dehydrogenase
MQRGHWGGQSARNFAGVSQSRPIHIIGDSTQMNSYQIAVLPGDGIGPEVMAAALRVLQHAATNYGPVDLQFTQHDAGAEQFRRTGCALPDEVLGDCLAADAVLLAAIGLPDVRRPDGTEVQPEMMMGLRRSLDLYAAVRPIKLYPGLPTPLRSLRHGIDLVILRENTEGLFASFGGGAIVPGQVATDTLIVTRRGTERVRRQSQRIPQPGVFPAGVLRGRLAASVGCGRRGLR